MSDASDQTLPSESENGAAVLEDGGAAPRTRQRTEVLRRAILDTAANLFAEKGYGGTNLQSIADAMGMSRPGLYYHFPSKEKILEAIIEELTLSTERQLAEIAREKEGDPEEALHLIIRTTTLWLLDHQVYFRVLDRSEQELPEDLRAANEASKRKNLEYMVGIIERGIAVGKFRPTDPHVAALAISGMRNWSAWWHRPNGRLSPSEIAEVMADMAVQSLLRSDAHRSRSDSVTDALRILQEDVAHLAYLVKR